VKPAPEFLNLPPSFWAHVRAISETHGYTSRKKATKGKIKVPTVSDMAQALSLRGLSHDHVGDIDAAPTEFGDLLHRYFEHRAEVLNGPVRSNLVDRNAAERLFKQLKKRLNPSCPLPLNKQKGKKRTYAFFTGIINMLIEDQIGDLPCNYDPRCLTTVTKEGEPLRTFARWHDGAFPSTTNPIAVWEIKEYYNTTTFGSRVADGVYESLLDGMEIAELSRSEGIEIEHYLLVDDRFTWWDCGRSYLCRLVDMMHMGCVDEVLFGREVVSRLPEIVEGWVNAAIRRGI